MEILIIIAAHIFSHSSCCKKRQSPEQEAGLGNRGRLKVLNDTKLVINEHSSSFLPWTFFYRFLQQTCSNYNIMKWCEYKILQSHGM